MSRQEQTLYLIALSKVAGVGDARVKKLVAYCGGAKAVFEQSRKSLEKIPTIGAVISDAVRSSETIRNAEEELSFAANNNVTVTSFLDEDYPQRLKHCEDAPVVLYSKGKASINPARAISIVGTRSATRYGKEVTESFVEGLSRSGITILSGLAYGIDISAHRACLKLNVPTIACLAHGLDRIYPAEHTNTANEMLENGALITDFPIGTKPDRENFPKRNRIVAGMADATVVIEAAVKGGALITAELANDYSRDVFAVPGRVGDVHSAGCHRLIMANKAALVTSADDILKALGWNVDSSKIKPPTQTRLLVNLSEDQEKLVALLREKPQRIDMLTVLSGFSMNKVASILLELEFEGVVGNLPGKVYKLN